MSTALQPKPEVDGMPEFIDCGEGIALLRLRGKYARNGDIGWAIVDSEDLPRLLEYNWLLSPNGYAIGAPKAYHMTTMHRLVAGTPHGLDTDHANGKRLDNRKRNLRAATRSQNNANSRARRHNKSGLKGVRETSPGRWSARITSQHLGTFDSPDEAHQAFQRAAEERYGQFVRKI